MWKQVRDTTNDSLVGVVHLAVGFFVVGYALNSETAFRLSSVPVVGPVLEGSRAFFNHIFDISGRD